MFATPDHAAVAEAAAALGMRIPEDQLDAFRTAVVEQLRVLDGFVQERLPEDRPPLTYAARDPGHRPTAEEDPFGAWLWRCRIEGAPEGLLAGKTVGFKDHVAVAGIPLTWGSFPLEGHVADFDATIVTRTLAAGGTITGKHTQAGFVGGWNPGSPPADYWRPRNPHDPECATGGSSSGSGAAVAARQVDISFGGDQGGSIRLPAAWCGTYGLKPTFALVSHFGLGFGWDQAVDHTGPMALTAEDTAAALQAVAGHDPYDPRQGREVPESIDVLSTLADGVAGLRIGVLDEGFLGADVGVADAVMAAVEVLAAAGAEVAKVSVPEHVTAARAAQALGFEAAKAVVDTGIYGMFAKTYYPASTIAAVNRMWADEMDLLAARNKLNLLVASFAKRTFHGRVYAKAANARGPITRAFDRALADVDVLVMPTSPTTAPRYDPDEVVEPTAGLTGGTMWERARNTQPSNFTGHPALAVPVGKVGGLPASMQLVGRHFDDGLLLRAAYAYERSVDWEATIAVDG